MHKILGDTEDKISLESVLSNISDYDIEKIKEILYIGLKIILFDGYLSKNEEIIKNIKGKKPFDIEFGFRIKNASGFGVLKDFLTDDVNKFDTLFELFKDEKDGKYGKKPVKDVKNLIKYSCFKNEIASFNEFIKEKGYTELIILPYIYIHKEIENNKLNEPTNLSKEFKEITQQCFDLFQIKKDEFKELLTFPNTID